MLISFIVGANGFFKRKQKDKKKKVFETARQGWRKESLAKLGEPSPSGEGARHRAHLSVVWLKGQEGIFKKVSNWISKEDKKIGYSFKKANIDVTRARSPPRHS